MQDNCTLIIRLDIDVLKEYLNILFKNVDKELLLLIQLKLIHI